MAEASKPLVLRADLHGLHAGFGFGLGLEGAVVDDCGRGGRRLGFDDGALLSRRVPHDVEFRRTCSLCNRGGSKSQCADDQNLFKASSLSFLRCPIKT